MDLFKYFKREGNHDCLCISDPYGPLNKQVPSSSIEESTRKSLIVVTRKPPKKRSTGSPYNFATPEQKVKVRKYAVANGTNYTLDCAAPFNKYCTKK